MGMGIIRLIFVTIVVLLSFKSNSNSVRAADDSLQCIHEYTSKCCDLSSLIYILFMTIAKFHCALRAREQKRLGDAPRPPQRGGCPFEPRLRSCNSPDVLLEYHNSSGSMPRERNFSAMS